VPERTSSDLSPSSVEAKNELNNTSSPIYYLETYTAATLSFTETRGKDHIDRPHLHLPQAVIFPAILLSNASSDLSFLHANIIPWQPSLEKNAFDWLSQATWAGGNRVDDKVWEAWTAVTCAIRRTSFHGLSYKKILSLHYNRLKHI